MTIIATPREQLALQAEDFSYELPGVWMKHVDDLCITIADGPSCNGILWEVQVMQHGTAILATEAHDSVEHALRTVEDIIEQESRDAEKRDASRDPDRCDPVPLRPGMVIDARVDDDIDDLFDRSEWPPSKLVIGQCPECHAINGHEPGCSKRVAVFTGPRVIVTTDPPPFNKAETFPPLLCDPIPLTTFGLPDALDESWLRWYLVDGLCSLCGNSGVIDTRATAISPRGAKVGRLNYCICPNGRTMRRSGATLMGRGS